MKEGIIIQPAEKPKNSISIVLKDWLKGVKAEFFEEVSDSQGNPELRIVLGKGVKDLELKDEREELKKLNFKISGVHINGQLPGNKNIKKIYRIYR